MFLISILGIFRLPGLDLSQMLFYFRFFWV